MGLLLALRFLTALPLPQAEVKPGQLGRAVGYFPAVGALLGLAVAGLDVLLRLVFPATVASVGVLIALALLTGALHLDGLMDTCDGLFGRSDPVRRLEIMRDSRVGSFGVVGAVCVLLLKYAALGGLAEPWRFGGLVAAPTFGRAAMVLAIGSFPYARPQGLGRAFKAEVGPAQLALALATAAAVAYVALGLIGVAMLVLAGGLAILMSLFVCSRIPGLTGDTYGAINEVVEVATMLALLALEGGADG